MKKLIAALLLCALVLSGCAQDAPAATQAPTTPPTTVPPTTEAPTEPPSEEELAQLKYEQMFAEGSYVMDWGCINMDVTSNILWGANYNIEILSDENGVYWEALRAYEDDPCSKEMLTVYYRNADGVYYFTQTTGYLGMSGHCTVNADFETEGTLMRENWNRAQSIFAEVIAKQEKVLYLGSEEGLDIVIVNPYATEPLLFYINPETNEVQELYMKTLEKLYHIEFIENNPDAVAKLTKKKALSGSIEYSLVGDLCDEIMAYLECHTCKKSGVWYTPKDVHFPAIEAEETAEEIAEKQAKWASIMANEAYVIDYDSWLRTDLWSKGSLMCTSARVVNEQGVQFEQYVKTDNNCYTKYYRVDEDTAYCYATYYENRHRWYSVDVNSPYTSPARMAEENEINRYNLEWFYDSVVYTKSVNGLDVLEGPHTYPGSTIELHINPETFEIKYVYMYVGCTAEIEFIYEDDVYIQRDIPAATHGTITFADVARLQDEVHVSGGGS